MQPGKTVLFDKRLRQIRGDAQVLAVFLQYLTGFFDDLRPINRLRLAKVVSQREVVLQFADRGVRQILSTTIGSRRNRCKKRFQNDGRSRGHKVAFLFVCGYGAVSR